MANQKAPFEISCAQLRHREVQYPNCGIGITPEINTSSSPIPAWRFQALFITNPVEQSVQWKLLVLCLLVLPQP